MKLRNSKPSSARTRRQAAIASLIFSVEVSRDSEAGGRRQKVKLLLFLAFTL
ncbi:hypothetical protein [Nostoc sp. DedQUE02]|uniref:hypothetical protein n=1 Tax=Nostoc sp. DedQUE02 TaxID=3075388 RepID=UPI002AD54AD2|nr:hypothetical protein [Nostoc sp. DedQUE03]